MSQRQTRPKRRQLNLTKKGMLYVGEAVTVRSFLRPTLRLLSAHARLGCARQHAVLAIARVIFCFWQREGYRRNNLSSNTKFMFPCFSMPLLFFAGSTSGTYTF